MQGPPPPPQRRGNGFVTAALVLGVLALVFAFASAVAVAVLLGALALTIGLILLRKRTGRGLAGTIMGSAGLVIAIALGTITANSSDEPVDASEQAVADPDASSGDGVVFIPDVTGKTVAEARSTLEAAGFKVASPAQAAMTRSRSRVPPQAPRLKPEARSP
ncbi:PASTA domain-containing protein [Curtobacterium aurantiacum]|uniref:PASTA domain-containing protein n=1 Tax=Curtobacterium aurantiacum TaxID=3236919 RepID=UPI001BDE3B39|nr:PASTA domain-containing protein [Curtobacterium flaccumfaciens]MBT1679793.1 PASTA domain-containing protein [Curtobacterium flaccumfaciens pv. flaccumfaciens]